MRLIIALLLVVALGASSAPGTEILWLTVKPSFSYRDFSTVCSNQFYPQTLYFGAEVEGLEVKKAVFRDSLGPIATQITLTAEELKGFVIGEDKKGQLWLKTVTMKGRLLSWMFFEAGGSGLSSCKPPQPLASIDPALFSFQFNIEKGGETAESNLAKFQGKLKDGAAYQAELQFSEKPYQLYRTRDLDSVVTETDLGGATLIEEVLSDSNWLRDSAEEELESATRETRLGSPVFSDRQDCRAIAINIPGLCQNRDCRGVLYHAQSYCQSDDCRGIVRGIVSYCQTRDCRAVIYNNIGLCESTNCRAVINKNFGMCR